ncbi:putative phosphoesterase, SbcD/Mre11-related/metallophosphoesterase, DNA ligase-associated [Algoriphagus locisalis]|uniref:Putative phosphoesterase, SbcD/Mre11-related/metallophosphoesterase, DNA ligase-associated n=1 Tax=Algoriphagus locisalis TaxID=305507 RepID=A0A1I6YU67_9BACT|nr:ligase-associated DNA damage response endonuclease PdeM [Algoriphagus locisalis]SFT53987.1 putative phosphoesterase, SbcD/Mre11-related/metallophosphoesterase, DNA ligase-associated [Algoriphagus locisalis]
MHSSITFSGTTLHLLAEKAIWISESKTLLIADLHFGKAAHFRKSGIPVPEPIHSHDLQGIRSLVEKYAPSDFYVLGDLFHSDWNEQWNELNAFLQDFPMTKFHLVKGNHDVLSPLAYQQSLFEIHEKPVDLGNLFLTHEPSKEIPEGKLNLCGHLHPGVRLQGKGRQSIRISCFHLGENQLILPAFGRFTGLALVKRKPKDQIFGISGEKVIKILSKE